MPSRATLQSALADRLGSAAEARWMLDEVLSAGGGAGAEPSRDEVRALLGLAARRLAGEPLQYLLGSWAFRTLELRVDRRALIPRPETEQVVEVALRALRAVAAGHGARPWTVADLGTGTGAIALSIAAELGWGGRPLGRSPDPALTVFAVDDDRGALSLVEENRSLVARTHPWVERQVRVREGNWFGALEEPLRGSLALVVSNPPYVASEEWARLDRELHYEPVHALVAAPGSDGTPGFAAVETIVTSAFDWLERGGSLVLELAPHQAAPARALAGRAGYREARIERDLAGRERALVALR